MGIMITMYCNSCEEERVHWACSGTELLIEVECNVCGEVIKYDRKIETVLRYPIVLNLEYSLVKITEIVNGSLFGKGCWPDGKTLNGQTYLLDSGFYKILKPKIEQDVYFEIYKQDMYINSRIIFEDQVKKALSKGE